MVTQATGTSKYHGSTSDSQRYFSSYIDSTLTTQYNSLDTNLKSILKQFQCYVSGPIFSKGTTSYFQKLRYIAAPACKEVGEDITTYCNEGNYQITFDYFNTSDAKSRRIITPYKQYVGWWLRSPALYNSSMYWSRYVETDGSISYNRVNSEMNIVWFGCI